MTITNVAWLVMMSQTCCPANTIIVNFAKTNITFINKITFPYPYENITELHLEDNIIGNLSVNDLQNLSYVTHLYLQGNSINHIFDLSFQSCNNMLMLDLSGNDATMLSNMTLYGLVQLLELFLHENDISWIADSAFYWSRNLTILNLSKNKLSFLTNRTFFGLDKLEHLDLGWNDLSSFSRVFYPLKSLLVLRINHNSFPIMKSDFFIGLEKLEKLFIDGNWKTTKIEDFAFSPLKNLYFWGNGMRVYTENAFKGLFKLTTFYPGWTPLSRIEEGAFSDLVRLQLFYGTYNSLETFSQDVFNSSNLPTHVRFSGHHIGCKKTLCIYLNCQFVRKTKIALCLYFGSNIL